MPFFIRKVLKSDVAAITRLSNQLGYPVRETDTLQNIEAIMDNDDEIILAAVSQEEIVGWIHVFKMVRVESGMFAEIGGLVVDERYRRKGIGKLLVEQAKQWCTRIGINALRVRCNTRRAEAHQFYSRLGFMESKQQKVFGIDLSST